MKKRKRKKATGSVELGAMVDYGPGYSRMRERLGEAGYEAMRQDTLRQQEAWRKRVSEEDPVLSPRDRRTYRTYPKSKPG